MAAEYKGLILKLGVEGKDVLSGLEKINKGLSGTKKELNSLEKSLKLNWDNKKFNEAQEIAQRRVTETKNKVDLLKRALEELQKQDGGKLSDEMKSLQNELSKAEKAAAGAEKQLNSLANLKLDSLANRIDNVGEKISGIGKTMMPVSAAAGAGLTFATKAAIDYEHAFTGVRKTVDATDEELQQMSRDLRDMSTEMPTTAVELANIAQIAGQLAIKTPNIVDFTRVIADLGTATDLAGEEGATMLAQFANVSQMPQDKFKNLGSTLVDLGNNSATTERNIMEMGTRLVGAGTQAGISEAKILGISAALKSVGLESEAGGSAFSKLINNMNVAVRTGSERLKDYANVAGMTAKQFSKAFQEDAAGALISFVGGLGKAGDDAVAILEDMDIKEVRMRDALLRSAGAGDLMRESIDRATTAWEENTALTNEATAAYQDTYNQIQIMQNQINDAAIEIGTMMLPTIRDLVNGVKDAAKWFTSLDDSTQKTILKILALSAALSPALIITGKLVTGVSGIVKTYKAAKTSIDAFKVANNAATISQAALNAVMNANPIVLLITALAALTLGIIGYNASVNKSTEYTDELNVKLREQADRIEESSKQYEDSKKRIEESTAATESQNTVIRESVSRLEELAEKTNKTAQEKAEMKRIVDDLNSAIPGLNLAMDSETGTLNMQIGVVWKAVDAWYALAKAKAAAQRYELEIGKQMDAEKQRQEAAAAIDKGELSNIARVSILKHRADNEEIAKPEYKYAAEKYFGSEPNFLAKQAAAQQANANYDNALSAEQQAIKDAEYWKNEMQKARAEADAAQAEVDAVKPSGSSGSSKSSSTKKTSGSSGKSSSSSDSARKARADKYFQNIKDTEDWNKNYYDNLKTMGELTDEQELKSLNDRAARYRQYAKDVLSLSFLTEEEKFEKFKEYTQKAESVESEAYQKQKKIQQDKASEYIANIEETERWNQRYYDNKKRLDDLSTDEEIKSIEDRANRYRKYAQDIMNLDGLTYEEKLQKQREYNEKAEDLDIDLYEYKRDLAEKEKEQALRILEEMKSAQMSYIQQQLDATRAALEEAKNAEIESCNERLKAQEKLLQAKLDAIDKELEARRRLREDEEQDSKIAKIQKQIKATEQQLAYSRDDETRDELMRELMRQQESLASALQEKEDTAFEREKQAEKDAVNQAISDLREKNQMEIENINNKYQEKLNQAEANAVAKEREITHNAEANAVVAQMNYNNSMTTNHYATDNRQTTVVLQETMSANKIARILNMLGADAR